MESYLEQVRAWNESQLKATEESLRKMPERAKVREEVAKAIDEAIEGFEIVSDWVGMNLEFIFKTTEEAREFTDKLLTLLGIEKAEKNFDGWKSTPIWFYEMQYSFQTIKVYPASPSEECIPVSQATSAVYWVCERREG